MTREEIIRMAREANFYESEIGNAEDCFVQFAALVAAASEAKEREECAKVCDEFESDTDPDAGAVLAAAIRARGAASIRGQA